jgi:Fungal Zn(2)-Cys(6) binuclear cluster domain
MSPGVAAFSEGDVRPAAPAASAVDGSTPELLNAVLQLQHQHHQHQESPSPPEDSPQLSPATAAAAAAGGTDLDVDDIDGSARPSAPLQKRRRVTRACDECRRKKIKCDGKQPCTHCTVYSYGTYGRRRSGR